jgi:hypothetical protein
MANQRTRRQYRVRRSTRPLDKVATHWLTVLIAKTLASILVMVVGQILRSRSH